MKSNSCHSGSTVSRAVLLFPKSFYCRKTPQTKTAFRLADENGKVLKTVYKGPRNPNDIGMEKASAALKEGIQEICLGIPYSRISMYAGIAGGGLTGDNARIFRQLFEKFGFQTFQNGSMLKTEMRNPARFTKILYVPWVVFFTAGPVFGAF